MNVSQADWSFLKNMESHPKSNLPTHTWKQYYEFFWDTSTACNVLEHEMPINTHESLTTFYKKKSKQIRRTPKKSTI